MTRRRASGHSIAAHAKEFGRSVAAALRVITTASPHTRGLIVTQLGRPALELSGMAKLIEDAVVSLKRA